MKQLHSTHFYLWIVPGWSLLSQTKKKTPKNHKTFVFSQSKTSPKTQIQILQNCLFTLRGSAGLKLSLSLHKSNTTTHLISTKPLNMAETISVCLFDQIHLLTWFAPLICQPGLPATEPLTYNSLLDYLCGIIAPDVKLKKTNKCQEDLWSHWTVLTQHLFHWFHDGRLDFSMPLCVLMWPLCIMSQIDN